MMRDLRGTDFALQFYDRAAGDVKRLVGGEEDGLFLGGAEDAAQRGGAVFRVEPRQRLVEHERVRRREQRPRERETAAHTAGVVAHALVADVAEPQLAQQRGGARRVIAPPRAKRRFPRSSLP